MSFSLFVASKYIRNKGDKKFISLISLITILGIALGVAILIITLSILDGFEATVTEKIVDFNSHIKITAFGNRNLSKSDNTLNNVNEIIGSDVKSISPFLSKLSIIKSKSRSEGITLIGVNNKTRNIELEKFVKSGSLNNLEDPSIPSIALGAKLVDKLFVSLGDTITIFSLMNDQIPSPTNPPAIVQFKIGALFESGMKEYDDLYAYMDLDLMRKTFSLDEVISGFNVRINDISKADSLSNILQENLRYPHYVRSVFALHRNIFTWLELQRKPIPLILALIIIVAVFNIVGTLLINVLEKTKEIGILKSLGAKRFTILKVFTVQGLFLAFIGILLGNLLAFIISFVQMEYKIISIPESVYYLAEVPIDINMFNYLLISIIAFVLCMAASLIPSFIASKVKPVSAMRFE